MAEPQAIPAAFVKICVRCGQTKPEAAFAMTNPGRRGSTCSDCRNARRRARGDSARRRALETPEQRRTRQLWEMYRLTREQYQELVNAQAGVCVICRSEPAPNKPLVVDHCHATGLVRALLCSPCNLMVGTYEQNHRAAADYLATYGNGNPLLKPHVTT